MTREFLVVLNVLTDEEHLDWWQALGLPDPDTWSLSDAFTASVFPTVIADEEVKRGDQAVDRAPVGSRWFWAHKHWVVTDKCDVDGEPGVVLSLDPEATQRAGKRKSAPPIATRLLVRHGIAK